MPKIAAVPVVMQMENLECGAACLAMILAYYGKWVPLEKVRTACGVSRDGSNARNILMAARHYGLEASGYRFEVEDIRQQEFPLIIHWNFNHFVVLNGFKKNCAVLNDPARGTVQVSLEEFDKSFTGIALAFAKTANFVAGGRPRSVAAFARTRLRGTLAPFLFVVLTGILTALAGVATPVFSRVFMDRILTRANPDWLYPFILAMTGLLAFQITVSVINTLYMLKIRGKLAIVANTTFFWHVLRLPVEFFSQRMAGDIAALQSANETIAEVLINQLAPVLLNLAMLVFYLAVMLKYSLLLTAVGLTASLINIWVARLISAKRINITRAMMRDSGKLAATTLNGIDMIETIKASGAENGYFERWAGYQAAVNSSSVRFALLNQYLGALPALLQQIASLAVLVLGVALIINGDFTPGMLLAFQGFMTSFLAPMYGIIGVGQSFQEMRSSMERIEDVLNYPPDVEYLPREEDEQQEYEKLSGSLTMSGVTFGYSRLAPPLIENFNLMVGPGQRVALVGPSGCGKSTLAKLVSGLYKPWSGAIEFDGVPQADICREIFTGSVAVIDQDIILFEDTLANNIKMWDQSIEDFEMIMAARDAQLHTEIVQREGGYNCPVLEGGRNFSGGQRQRIEIARVLAQDPRLVILDEATSALDAKTEYELINAIKDRGIACIIVAHRLSTIRDCDEIIVLDKGRVVERGRHEELYRAGGLYTGLIATE
ncbi:MAG: Lactococcin-G-processing and transport ATP-binding protein LagD [Firmicutes bacterium ADurb.Bin373]|nr:MAG: Lactococcin-G-processing and transport ATP-binding protein LagD [Firmicutes bacterium ADurb.Bin373]